MRCATRYWQCVSHCCAIVERVEYATEADARAAKAVIDRWGCGPLRRQLHEVRDLRRPHPSPRTRRARPQDTEAAD